MPRKFFFLLSLIFCANGFSQIEMIDADLIPFDCGSASSNFQDHSGGGNYLPNTDDTLVICPDLTNSSKLEAVFGTTGMVWSIDASDTLYIYDGASIQSPLLGTFNSVTNPVGFSVQSTFENNPSGCLTFRFLTDNQNEGEGWLANLTCISPPQPFSVSLSAYVNGQGTNMIANSDTGLVNICQGDSILFIAHPDFQYAFENTGAGYSQTLENVDYLWYCSTSGSFVNNDSIVVPNSLSGYYLSLIVSDQHGAADTAQTIVRIGSPPDFSLIDVPDSLCIGDTLILTTQIPQYTSNTIFINNKVTSTDLFALPDGSGVYYDDTLLVTGEGGYIGDISMIPDFAIGMEHSFSGDLEIEVICPSGNILSIANFYNQSGGLIPLGCGNAANWFIGNDTDIDGGPGGSPVWEYKFSVQNGSQTLCSAYQSITPIINSYGYTAFDTSIVYLPDGDPNNLIGCPFDGNWTLRIQDNQGIDDGHVFHWTIDRTKLVSQWTNYPDSIYWTGTNIQSFTDSSATVICTDTGWAIYQYHVIDDFGCEYDTAVSFYIVNCSLPNTASLSELEVANIVFPNPADKVLNYSGNKNVTEIVVYDMSGKEVLSTDSFPVAIDMLPNGSYLLKILSADALEFYRVTKVE